jgi:hypothetical protein
MKLIRWQFKLVIHLIAVKGLQKWLFVTFWIFISIAQTTEARSAATESKPGKKPFLTKNLQLISNRANSYVQRNCFTSNFIFENKILF